MEFNPPVPLSITARKTWDRHAQRIYSEGRWPIVNQDMLVVFCQTLELYEQCKAEIDAHGVLVQGRTTRELVRNPALTPLNQARASLVHLARAVPLVDPKPAHESAAFDAYLDELLAE